MRKLPLLHRIADLPARVASALIPAEWAKRRMHRVMTRYGQCRGDRVLAVGGAYDFKKDMLKTAWLLDVRRHQFEDRHFFCPTDIDDYLVHMYGDFMAYPPVEQRRGKHRVLALEFDDEREGDRALQSSPS